MTLSLKQIEAELIAELPKATVPWKLIVSKEKVYAANPEHEPRILWREEDGKIHWKIIQLTEGDFETAAGKDFQKHLRKASAQNFINANAGRKGFRALPKKKGR